VRGYREEVQFVFKPYPLGKESLPEIGALYAAHRRGEFKDMLEAQYERQKETGGISIEDVQAISDTIGLDATSVLRAVSTKGYRMRAIKNASRGQNVGVDRVPTVLINGHFAGTRRGRCLAAFIEAAKRGELQPGKTYRSK
jgi:predicted DsbA family dithiol-disulfide isomerase